MKSLFSTLLEANRFKKTVAYYLTCYEKTVGLLYIQEGIPKSCEFAGLTGFEALEMAYREERSGLALEFIEQEELGIFSENIKVNKFETFIMSLLEKFRQKKIFKNYSLDQKTTVNYWQ